MLASSVLASAGTGVYSVRNRLIIPGISINAPVMPLGRKQSGACGRSSQLLGRRQPLSVTAVAVPQGNGDAAPLPVSTNTIRDRVKQLFTPFSDPAANSKLLALCTAQALCSVATLIHDTYLPVYLSDVLHLSNSSVSLEHRERDPLSNRLVYVHQK
jgi:hypothetical protein